MFLAGQIYGEFKSVLKSTLITCKLFALSLGIIVLAGVAIAGEHPVALEKNFDPAKCTECHEEKTKGKVVHAAIAAGCTSCHEVKVEDDVTDISLIAPSSRELCLTCHSDKDVKGAVHPPVTKDCVTCHSPHASENTNLLLKTSSGDKAQNQCLACHDKGEKVPEKGSRHAALDMGCDSCHITHKTGDPSKEEFAFHLKKASPALCLDCHDSKEKTFLDVHQNQPVAEANCSNCHDAHQSPYPKLINANAHPPFAEKACDACHQAPKAGKVVLNEEGKFPLCYTCHDGMKKQVEESKTQHSAFSVTDTCTSCHNPHASRNPRLVQSSQGQVCAACHEKSTDPVRHGPYDRGQCADCHDAHGTELPKLLRADGNGLCRGCHVLGQPGVKVDGDVVSLPWTRELTRQRYEAIPKIGLDRGGETGHPLVRHPVSGKNTRSTKQQSATLSCRSCHQAHSSKAGNLMPSNVKDSIQLCEQCHT